MNNYELRIVSFEFWASFFRLPYRVGEKRKS